MADRLNNIAGLFKDGRTRSIILATMLILLIAIVVGVLSMRAKVKGVPASAGISNAPGGIQSVPFDAPNAEYARLQAQQNNRQAKTAEESGGSAIPTIFKSSKDIGSIAATDQNTGPGFIGLSREQESGGTFEPKSFGSDSTADKAKNCPVSETLGGDSRINTPIYDANGRLIGYAGSDGKVKDVNGAVIGVVGPDELMRDFNGKVLGQKGTAVTGTPVYNANGRLIGYTGGDGKIYDVSGKLIGAPGPDGIVRDAAGKVIGQLSKPVYDPAGKLLGFAGLDGKVRDANGSVIGTAGADGVARDLNGNIIGKAGAISPGTAVYDPNGNIAGYFGPDGKVRDANGNVMGSMGIDGQVKDINGAVIGSINKPQQAINDAQNVKMPLIDQSKLTPDQMARQNLQSAYDQERQISQDQKLSQAMLQKQQAMMTQAGQLLTAWVAPMQQYVPGDSKQDVSADAANSDSVSPQNASGSKSPSSSGGPVFIKAGTIYYAVVNTAINSDEPGPIMATIISGQFKGGKLLGALTNQGKAVMLSFNILTLQQFPKSISISSVAIDQNTARTGLSTETNNHYLLRYGSLFASAFIQGYAQAISSSGTTVSSSPFTATTTSTPPLSPQEKFYVALGNVGTQFSNQLGSTFNKPPTVYVASGTAVGILFMSDVLLPAS